jgi:hypothetical protein
MLRRQFEVSGSALASCCIFVAWASRFKVPDPINAADELVQ